MKERLLTLSWWLIAAAFSAYACALVVQRATPIDAALPFIAMVVVAVAWSCSETSLLLAVPLLIVCEIGIVDESLRLLAFGVVLACTIGFALVRPTPAALPHPLPAMRGEGRQSLLPASRGEGGRRPDEGRNVVPLIAAIALLRWIPFENTFREILLLAIAVTISYVLGRTPFAHAVAILTALVTPAIPLRTLALPLVVLIVAIAARAFGMPRLRWTLPSVAAVSFAMLFFAWSGIVARAWPYFLKPLTPAGERAPIRYAIQPSHSETIGVPENARALIVSGANVPRLRRGTLLGTIEPGNLPIRVGDAADWGYLRREHFYGSRNPLPRDPAGKIRGYGYAAWIDGAGRVPLPRGAKLIRVTAASSLPPGSMLQVEAFELAPQ